MAKKAINPIEQHAEKGVLGLAALALLGSVGYFLIMGVPYSVEGWSGEPLGPSSIGQALDDQARQVAMRWINLGPPPPAETSGESKLPVQAFALFANYSDIQPAIPPMQPYPPPLVEGERPSVTLERPLVGIVAPEILRIASFRNVLSLPPPEGLDAVVERNGPAPGDIVWGDTEGGSPWMTVQGVVPLDLQKQAFEKAGYPLEFQDLTVYDVQAQRRRVVRTSQGDWYSDWESIDSWLPFTRPALPELSFADDGVLSATDRVALDGLWSVLRRGQRWILRSGFPKSSSGNRASDPKPVIPYLKSEPKGFHNAANPGVAGRAGGAGAAPPARRWAGVADGALQASPADLKTAYLYAEAAYYALGVSPKDRPRFSKTLDDIDAAMRNQGGNPPARELRRRMPWVIYDLSARPGAWYQYRARLRAFNRFAGRPYELARVADSRQVLIPGAWSAVSDPVEAEADTYMYLVRADKAKGAAKIEVFRSVGRGAFDSKKFDVKPGDFIGEKERGRRRAIDYSTGAMVVAIDFDFRFRPPGSDRTVTTTALIYTDPNDPSAVRELILARDEIDQKRLELDAG
ncbi:MAG: hypothetical protein V3T70_00815 [Phycisphaerae bacterium]